MLANQVVTLDLTSGTTRIVHAFRNNISQSTRSYYGELMPDQIFAAPNALYDRQTACATFPSGISLCEIA